MALVGATVASAYPPGWSSPSVLRLQSANSPDVPLRAQATTTDAGCSNCLVANLTSVPLPQAVTYDPLDGNLYVSSGDGYIGVVNGSTDAEVAQISGGGILVVDPSNGDLLLPSGGNVSLISGSTYQIVRNLSVSTTFGNSVTAIAVDPASGDVYAEVNNPSVNVSVTVFKLSTGARLQTIEMTNWAGEDPGPMLYDSLSGDMLVVNEVGDNLTVINGTTRALAGSVPVGVGPGSIVMDAKTGDVYVSNSMGNAENVLGNVTVLQGKSLSPVASLTAGVNPGCMAYDSANGLVYVVNTGGGNTTILDGGTLTVSGSIPAFPRAWHTGVCDGQTVAFDSEDGYLYFLSAVSSGIYSPASSLPYVESITVSPSVVGIGNETNLTTVVAGGSQPYLFSYSGLPPGCETTNSGVLACTPTSPGNYVVTIQINDSFGNRFVSANLSATLSIALEPVAARMVIGTSQVLSVNTTCVTSACQSGLSFSWTVNSSGGSLNSTSTKSVEFTALQTGQVMVNVTVAFSDQTEGRLSSTIAVDPLMVTPSPGTISITAGSEQNVTVTTDCSGPECATELAYRWALGPGLGSLNASTGSSIALTALEVGTGDLNVSASLDGEPAGTASISVSVRSLAVVADPTSITMADGSTQVVSVSSACSGPECGRDLTYRWTLGPGLGSLNVTDGPTVAFTALDIGRGDLNVTALLDGEPVGVTTVPVLVQALLITIAPNSYAIEVGGSLPLSAAATCSASICDGQLSYSWALSNSLGSLNASSGPEVELVAGSTPGNSTVEVTVDLEGQFAGDSSAAVTIDARLSATLDADRLGTDVNASVTLTAGVVGGTGGPDTYSYVESSDIGGCVLSTGPSITCTPTAAGSFTVTVNVSDAHRDWSLATSASILVSGALSAALTVSNATPLLGQTVAFVTQVAGGVGPYSYAYAGFPPGCVSENSSAIGCLPTQADYYNVTVSVRDHNNVTVNASASVRVVFDFNVIAPSNTSAGSPFTISVNTNETFSGGTALVPESGFGAFTYNYSGLPPGCASRDSASITCTPTQVGAYHITIAVRDQVGDHQTHTVVVNVVPAKPATGILGLSGDTGYFVVGVVAAAVAAAAIALSVRSRRSRADPDRNEPVPSPSPGPQTPSR